LGYKKDEVLEEKVCEDAQHKNRAINIRTLNSRLLMNDDKH